MVLEYVVFEDAPTCDKCNRDATVRKRVLGVYLFRRKCTSEICDTQTGETCSELFQSVDNACDSIIYEHRIEVDQHSRSTVVSCEPARSLRRTLISNDHFVLHNLVYPESNINPYRPHTPRDRLLPGYAHSSLSKLD